MIATSQGAFRLLPRRVIAFLLAILGFFVWLDYPVFKPLLAGLLVAYGLAMRRWPLAWLAILPACVPMLQLAHWSGRLFVEDLDILFIATLAMLLWRAPAPHGRSHMSPITHLVLLALAVSYVASLAIGLVPWPNWRAPDLTASFLSPADALRQSKGFIWAMLLSPFVIRAFGEHPDSARRLVLGGMVAGGLATGVMALWERGVWQALLYGRDLYQILGPLLDFSTPYRVTGTFAEMNTGGEAIDGYLGLAWPMMILALALSRRAWTLAVSSLALGLVLYSLVTTFSRGLYFSLAVAGAVWLLGLARVLRAESQDHGSVRLWPVLFLLAVAASLLAYGYSRGGMPGLASAALIFGVAAWLAWRPISLAVDTTILMAALGVCLGVAVRGMVTSKWHPIALQVAAPTGLLLVGGVGLLGYAAGRLLPRDRGVKPYLAMLMVLVVGAGTLAPALLGYRMTERFSGVAADFSTRAAHWRHVLSLKDGHFLDEALGMGLGSFPREFHWDNAHRPEGSGDFSLVREQGNTFLRTTGGKDLRLGQRVSVAAMEPLHLTLRVRTAAPEAWLRIRLCRRFVIHPTEWNGQCVSINPVLSSTHGTWQTLAFDLNSGRVGDGLQWGRPPLMLEIHNRREFKLMSQPPAVVDMDDIRLTDGKGRPLVANGNFEQGTDRWLPYYDFNHLPWHVKNLWLHLYFEQGVLGMLAFASAWLVALVIGWRAAARGDLFAVGVAAALTGFVAVGTFGSPIDAPRVAWLYYFLLFVQVAQSRDRGRSRPHGRLRQHTVHPHAPTR